MDKARLSEETLAAIKEKLQEERNAQRNMTIGETLPSEEARKDMVEKNKLYFFLIARGLMEDYIAFCADDKADWGAAFWDATRM